MNLHNIYKDSEKNTAKIEKVKEFLNNNKEQIVVLVQKGDVMCNVEKMDKKFYISPSYYGKTQTYIFEKANEIAADFFGDKTRFDHIDTVKDEEVLILRWD